MVTVSILGLVDCISGESVTSGTVNVPANGTVTTEVLGCVLASCPGGLVLTVTVTGATGSTDPCVGGTSTSTCTATVICQQAATCRVTGGGVLLPGDVEESTCEEGTDIVTEITGPDCNGAEALKVTHGGQLGAPFSQPSCGDVENFPQGNPCIRGQWEHVRHYQGKANPRTSFQVDNFHSATPKGMFDSLLCACLPCCESESEDSGLIVDGLCNPDDRRICGPLPRSAPANAIIFTGVGYIRTCTASNQRGKGSTQAVIFRVYIEDRSEPGGQFPGGAIPPADVYCFQAWAINGQHDSQENIDLRQTVANDSCNFIQSYSQGTLPDANVIGEPLVNDCGALSTGNHQIHPSTAAICDEAEVE